MHALGLSVVHGCILNKWNSNSLVYITLRSPVNVCDIKIEFRTQFHWFKHAQLGYALFWWILLHVTIMMIKWDFLARDLYLELAMVCCYGLNLVNCTLDWSELMQLWSYMNCVSWCAYLLSFLLFFHCNSKILAFNWLKWWSFED